MIDLKIIHGSTRPSRDGYPISLWIEKIAREHGGFLVELIDLAEVALPLLDEPEHPAKYAYVHDHTRKWSAQIAAADAFIFVTPEYDYFPSAALVNAVQCLSREWANKPAGIISYGGISGGLRAAEALRQLLSGVRLVPLPSPVPLPLYSQYLDKGLVLRPTEPLAAGATALLGQLQIFAEALRPTRP